MLKMIAFLSIFLPSVLGNMPTTEQATCNCPSVTNLQKTGQTSSSISYSWSPVLGSSGYTVWYYRTEGQYTSATFSPNGTAYSFTGLVPGHYTFHVQAVCGGEGSNIIGVEDQIIQ